MAEMSGSWYRSCRSGFKDSRIIINHVDMLMTERQVFPYDWFFYCIFVGSFDEYTGGV